MFSCQSIEFMLIKFQMGTINHNDLTSKKFHFMEKANEKGPRIMNKSVSNDH